MKTRRWASIFALMVLAIPSVLGAPKQKADRFIPNLPVPLEYPDEQPYFVKGGKITLSLILIGSATVPSSDRTTTLTASASAQETLTLTASGGTRQYSFDGKTTIVSTDKWGKTSTMRVTGQSHGSKAIPEVSPGQGPIGPIAVSSKLKSATAAIYRAWSGTDWRMPDIEGEMTVDKLPPQKMGGGFTARVPCFGGGGSSFSGKVNELEASGGEDQIMTAGGIVESAWQDGGLHGSFTVPVLAACNLPGSYVVNTVPVMQRLVAQFPGAAKWALVPGTLTVTWELGNAPLKFEMVMEPFQPETYEKWLPVPPFERTAADLPLLVKVELKAQPQDVKAPRARMDFYLKEVSRHRGECGNYPRDRKEKDDLKFSDKQPEGIIVDPGDPKHAYTKDPEVRAVVAIQAEDAGAYGHLEVRCDDLDLSAEYKRLGVFYLAIPKDDNSNHIGDAWEKEKGILGQSLPANWDQAEVVGHKNKGDGLGLYEKYRGFMVLEGTSPKWLRLEPRVKVLFVFDHSWLFDSAAWGSASGIKAYRLSDDLAAPAADPAQEAARIVNVCSGSEKNGDKYGVVIHAIEGADGDNTLGVTRSALLPRTVEYCRIYLATHRKWIEELAKKVQKAATDKHTPESQDFDKNGIPHWLVERAAQSLADPAFREALLKQQLRSTTLHEVGHACGLPGHVGLSGGEGTTGNRMCFMCYTEMEQDWQYIVLQTVFKAGSTLPVFSGIFCKDADFNCWGHLDVKDN
jgi:hypothetical protein